MSHRQPHIPRNVPPPVAASAVQYASAALAQHGPGLIVIDTDRGSTTYVRAGELGERFPTLSAQMRSSMLRDIEGGYESDPRSALFMVKQGAMMHAYKAPVSHNKELRAIAE